MNTLVASSAAVWRAWLADNGRSHREVWLVLNHKDSGIPSLRYHEAIEHVGPDQGYDRFRSAPRGS